MKPTLSLDFSLSLRQELRSSVDPDLDKYWSGLLLQGGIFPEEMGSDDESSQKKFAQDMDSFGEYVGNLAEQAFGAIHSPHRNPYIVHVVGVGTGHDLRHITISANNRRMPVWAYDTARVAHSNTVSVFDDIGGKIMAYPRNNRVFLADIERVCREDVLHPDSARFLLLIRILEALNKPSKDPAKMDRVCRKIGPMLDYLKVLVIGPRTGKNLGVKFNNNEPIEIEEIVQPMEQEFDRPIRTTEFEGYKHFRHHYSATLIEKD